MSRLRNRNIRTKIQALSKWGAKVMPPSASANNHGDKSSVEEHGINTTTTGDSGIAEVAMAGNGRDGAWLTGGYREKSEEEEEEESSGDEHLSGSSVNTLKVLDEIRNLGDGLRSNSADAGSLNSWSEDYEGNATALVRAEYERMERVLQCREPIPSHYDKDEYKLWIKQFPCLSLVSRSNHHQQSATSCDKSGPTPSPSVNNTLNPRTLNLTAMDHSFLQLAPLNFPPIKRPTNLPPTTTSATGKQTSRKRNYDNQLASTTGAVREWLNDTPNTSDLQRRRAASNNTFYPPNGGRLFEKRSTARRRGGGGGVGGASKTELLKSTSEFIVLPPIEARETARSVSAANLVGKVQLVPLGKLHHHAPVYPLYENNEREGDRRREGFTSYRHRKRKYHHQ